MKKNTKISTKMAISFSILALLVATLFYFLLPSLLNYPPDTINTQFDKEVSKLYYIFQYMIAVFSILILFVLYFKTSLKKIDKWMETKDKKQISEIRKICFSYPFGLFVAVEFFPVIIVLLTLVLTRKPSCDFTF